MRALRHNPLGLQEIAELKSRGYRVGAIDLNDPAAVAAFVEQRILHP